MYPNMFGQFPDKISRRHLLNFVFVYKMKFKRNKQEQYDNYCRCDYTRHLTQKLKEILNAGEYCCLKVIQFGFVRIL